MADFEKVADGLHVQLDETETGILRGLAREMRLLLESDIPAGDDVMERLFPRAHEDDNDEAAYQDLVGNELRTVKQDALRVVEARLGTEGSMDSTLPDGEIHEWLRMINDMRLAIGTRLEVDDVKMEKEYDPEDPEAPALSVLHWLGVVQASIIEEIA